MLRQVVVTLAVFFVTVSSAYRYVPFTKSLGNYGGLDVALKTGSACMLEAEDLNNLSVNCTLVFRLSKGTAFSYEAKLFGGANIIRNNTGISAQVNFRLSLPNPLDTANPIAIPSGSDLNKVITFNVPSASGNVCASKLASKFPELGSTVAAGLTKIGADACLNVNLTPFGTDGAGLSIVLQLNLFDPAAMDSTLGLLLGGLGVKAIAPPAIDIGKLIFSIIQSQSATSGPGRQLADASTSFVNSQGQFLLGTANQFFGLPDKKWAIPFSGTVGVYNKFNITVKSGSGCDVEVQDVRYLGANCTIKLGLSSKGTDFVVTFSAGVSFQNNKGNLQAVLNYQGIFPNPLETSNPIVIPNDGVGNLTYNIFDLNNIPAVCATNVLTLIPTAATKITGSLLKSTGTDACLDISLTTTQNGAQVSLFLDLFLFDTNKVDPAFKLPLQTIINVFGLDTGGGLWNKKIDIGQLIVALLRQNGGADPSAKFIDANGVFLFGKANPTFKPDNVLATVVSSDLVAPSVPATSTNIAFSGAVGTFKGITLSLQSGSSCDVEYQNIANLGVNCTVILSLSKGNNNYAVTLRGGTNLVTGPDGKLKASLLYQASLPNPISPLTGLPNPLLLPSSNAGALSYTLPDINVPSSLCVSSMLSKVGGSEGQLASNFLGKTGTDACILLNVTTNGNTGALVSLIIRVDMFNTIKMDGTQAGLKNALITVLSGLGVATNYQQDIDVGKLIVALLRNKLNANAAVTSNGRRLDSTAALNDNGQFTLGSASPGTAAASPAVIAGISIGLVAVVVAIVVAVVFIRKSRSTGRV